MTILLDQASLLLEQGRSRDAAVKIRQYLQQDPNNDYALSLLARCLYDGKQFEEGLELLQDAISFNPRESYYFYLLGFGYYRLDKPKPALEQVAAAIKLNPLFGEYYGLYAFILLGEKDFKQGLEKANEGLAVEADNLTCLNARAMALNKLKKTDEAIATMQHALAQDPDSEFTHNTVGWNLLERGRHQEAAGHFREALRINPGMQNAQSGLKESLKSKVPPYKWLLQYSFWVNNQGKKLKTAMPFALLIGFRILVSVFSQNSSTAIIAWILAGIYIVFVIGSWTMNSVANCFLLFHPDGRYALTHTEKCSAISVVSAMVVGLTLSLLALFTNLFSGLRYEDAVFGAGLVLLSLALPLGEINYPVRYKGTGPRNRYSLLLIAAAALVFLLSCFFPAQSLTFMGGYALLFLVYNWSGVLRSQP